MSILNLFHYSYYFDSGAYQTFPGFWVVLGLAVVALIGSLVLKKRSGKMNYVKRSIISRVTGPLFTVSWIFLVWMFFRYEGVVYLSWRLWPALLFIYLVVSAVLLYRFIRVELPKKKEKATVGGDTKDSYLRRFTKGHKAGGNLGAAARAGGSKKK